MLCYVTLRYQFSPSTLSLLHPFSLSVKQYENFQHIKMGTEQHTGREIDLKLPKDNIDKHKVHNISFGGKVTVI